MTLEREVQEQEYNISARNTETHSLQVVAFDFAYSIQMLYKQILTPCGISIEAASNLTSLNLT